MNIMELTTQTYERNNIIFIEILSVYRCLLWTRKAMYPEGSQITENTIEINGDHKIYNKTYRSNKKLDLYRNLVCIAMPALDSHGRGELARLLADPALEMLSKGLQNH